MSAGFYKHDANSDSIIFAANAVHGPGFDLSKDDPIEIKKKGLTGWIWFDTDVEAYDYFKVIKDPSSISAMSAKIALENIGKLGQIETYMATATKQEQIAWNNATTFNRNSPMLATVTKALGMTSQEVDDLFIAAKLIVV